MGCSRRLHQEANLLLVTPERMSRSPEPFASLKGKLREGEGSGDSGAEILPLRYAQGCGSCAQDDMIGWTVSVALDMK